MDAASIRTRPRPAGRRYGHLVERRAPGADSRLRIARIVSTAERSCHGRNPAAEPGYDRARAGTFAQPRREKELDGAVRQPARAAPAAGKRRRCDRRLPRRARRPRAARARDAAASSRERRRSSDPIASRPITGASLRRSRASGGTGTADAGAASARAAPRVPIRFLVELVARYVVVSHVKNVVVQTAQPVLAPRAGGRGGLAGARAPSLARATDAQALVEITKSREIGVPTFVIGGLLIPAGISLWRLASGTIHEWWIALLVGAIGIAIGLAHLVVRPARRRAREPAHPTFRDAAARGALAHDRELRRAAERSVRPLRGRRHLAHPRRLDRSPAPRHAVAREVASRPCRASMSRRLPRGSGRRAAAYEVVHESPGLELGVYVLVAPEPDRQTPHAYDEVYVVARRLGRHRGRRREAEHRAGGRRLRRALAPSTGSRAMSPSRCS